MSESEGETKKDEIEVPFQLKHASSGLNIARLKRHSPYKRSYLRLYANVADICM